MIPFSGSVNTGNGPWWAATQPEEAHMAIDAQPALSPHLVVDDANAAIDFYVKAFGAVEMGRVPRQDGKLIHGAVQIDGSLVMLADDFPEMSDGKSMTPKAPWRNAGHDSPHRDRRRQPLPAGGRRRGATVVMPLEDQFWGDRYGVVRDRSDISGHWASRYARSAPRNSGRPSAGCDGQPTVLAAKACPQSGGDRGFGRCRGGDHVGHRGELGSGPPGGLTAEAFGGVDGAASRPRPPRPGGAPDQLVQRGRAGDRIAEPPR